MRSNFGKGLKTPASIATNANLECVFVENTLDFIVPKIGIGVGLCRPNPPARITLLSLLFFNRSDGSINDICSPAVRQEQKKLRKKLRKSKGLSLASRERAREKARLRQSKAMEEQQAKNTEEELERHRRRFSSSSEGKRIK